jgi:hypothetical protein
VAKKKLNFSLTPTQLAYVESDAVVNAIIGPMGDGKIYASIAAIIRHAQRCGRPIRAAIVRSSAPAPHSKRSSAIFCPAPLPCIRFTFLLETPMILHLERVRGQGAEGQKPKPGDGLPAPRLQYDRPGNSQNFTLIQWTISCN